MGFVSMYCRDVIVIVYILYNVLWYYNGFNPVLKSRKEREREIHRQRQRYRIITKQRYRKGARVTLKETYIESAKKRERKKEKEKDRHRERARGRERQNK